MLELPDRYVPDPGHEANLMVDQNEGRVLGGERFVGARVITFSWFVQFRFWRAAKQGGILTARS